jgi:hypothetical protein
MSKKLLEENREERRRFDRSLFPPAPTHQDHGVTPAIFEQWRSPRFGTENPTNLTNPFWVWQVKTKISSMWVLREMLSEEERKDERSSDSLELTWCMDRYYRTLTHLPDGVLIFIGGWNDDPGCPTCTDYNDVVVIAPSGEVSIYGYPEDCFPPIQNHSATLVARKIVIIGKQIYSHDRNANSQFVYLLDVDTFVIQRIETHGEIPPALFDPSTELAPDGKVIRVTDGEIDRGYDLSNIENIDDWSLDVSTWQWKRLTKRNWSRWEFHRMDGERNHIADFRSCLEEKERLEDYLENLPVHVWRFDMKERLKSRLKKACDEVGQKVDLDDIASLYRPSIPHEEVMDDSGDIDLEKIQIAGVLVRFAEVYGKGIQMTIEGELPASTIQTLIEEILAKFKLLENAEWKVKPIQSTR